MSSTPGALLYAVLPDGLRALDLAPGIRDVNEAFDALPLGIYEGLRTFDHHRLVGLEEHLDRAAASMRALGWSEELDRAALRGALDRILRASPYPDSRVRFDVLAGPARALGTDARTLVALSPLEPLPASFLEEGVGVPLVRDLRRERPRIKLADFVIRRRLHPTGGQWDYEPMMVDAEDRILEGTSSNFFAVLDGELRTAGDDVLLGITRAFLLRFAREEGIAVREEAVGCADLPRLAEAFLSSSVRSLIPIVRMDGTVVGEGRPGPVSLRLLERYAEHVRAHARPAAGEGSS